MQKTISKYDPVKYKTPTGTGLNCKGWIQEAALRMLLNNLNPEVAERPDELIVYGGRGKAARNFQALDDILANLKILENDETLLIQSGKPVGQNENTYGCAKGTDFKFTTCSKMGNLGTF